jgi:RimJ/RimL family protein N-acetyltransferase
MPWTISEDLDDYTTAAGPFLRSRPAQHTVELTIVETMRSKGPQAFGQDAPVFGWWQRPGEPVTGAFLQTPPFPLLITGAPGEAAAQLADRLAATGRELPGVNSSEQTAGRFAGYWRQRTGAASAVHQRTRLFRLGELIPPSPAAPGRARVAPAADRDQVVAWFGEFMAEAGSLAEQDPARQADDRMSYGGITLWEDGGIPVSMAGVTRKVADTIRVGPVYTPPALRGRGYGTAATAAVTRAALDCGVAEVLLFTDQANPTSNGIYQRLGYRPVEDRVILAFHH